MNRQETSDGERRPGTPDRAERQRRHAALVRDAEVKLLVHTLEPFGLLRREELIRRTDATLWRTGTFDDALRTAVAQGLVKILPDGSVELRRA